MSRCVFMLLYTVAKRLWCAPSPVLGVMAAYAFLCGVEALVEKELDAPQPAL